MKKLMMAVMVAGMAAAALADVSFSYSGQLRNETGGAVSEKNPTITFSLYTVATGGTALWSRMMPVLLDANGYFAVELSNAVGSPVGSEVVLEQILANNATLYIGLNVEGSSGEISPRQKLLSTPRAAFAEDVQTAKQGFTVNGAAVFVNGLQIGGSGTSAKAEINSDGEITAKKLTLSTGDASASGTLSAKSAKVTDKVSAKNVEATDTVKAVKVNATTAIQQGGNTLIPRGTVVMWAGAQSTVPAGWHLCDGTEGTPDLRGRFVVCSGKSSDGDTDYSFANTGGKEKVKLSVSEMPSHTHEFGQDINLNGVGGYSKTSDIGGKGFDGNGGYQLHNYNSKATGGGQFHENRPPYFALAFIMKL